MDEVRIEQKLTDYYVVREAIGEATGIGFPLVNNHILNGIIKAKLRKKAQTTYVKNEMVVTSHPHIYGLKPVTTTTCTTSAEGGN